MLKFWSRFLYAGQKTFSASSRGWWGGVVEIGLATLLFFSGFLFVVAALALQYFYSDPTTKEWYYTAGQLGLRIAVALILLGLGVYRMLVALWRVSTTVERREAIATAATDFDLFSDSRASSRGGGANMPRLANMPTRGTELAFRLSGRRRRYSWLLFTALSTLIAFSIATVLGARLRQSLLQADGIDYGAAVMTVIAFLAGVWGAVGFMRQAMRLAAFGPTVLEISRFPLQPGEKFRILLFQPGRFRFKLLEVLLVCEEVATYTRGTDIQTETRRVIEERLYRHRGVNVTPKEPFRTEFEFELPSSAMHSFSSKDNQIQWKIVVQTIAKGWPRVEQVFPVLVYPRNVAAPSASPPTPSMSPSSS